MSNWYIGIGTDVDDAYHSLQHGDHKYSSMYGTIGNRTYTYKNGKVTQSKNPNDKKVYINAYTSKGERVGHATTSANPSAAEIEQQTAKVLNKMDNRATYYNTASNVKKTVNKVATAVTNAVSSWKSQYNIKSKEEREKELKKTAEEYNAYRKKQKQKAANMKAYQKKKTAYKNRNFTYKRR